MPIAIGQIDSTVEVEAGDTASAGGEAAQARPPQTVERWRWELLARREAESQSRVSAWGFED
ncbi:hypothetical protein WNB94_08475 [Aquabacterium sp. A3]|uniref:hypothetical protein n=1 Tax=Aquabacterium sp. A3 TaxID=3132829 RepID=UPI0031195ECA